MKEWQPDRDFKKADFPAQKEKESKKSAGPTKPTPTPPVRKIAKPVEPKTTDLKEGRTVKAWLPPSVSAEPVIKPKPSRSSRSASSPRLIEPESRKDKDDLNATRRASADMTGQLLDDLMLGDLNRSADLLRQWYWQKPQDVAHTKIYVILHSVTKETLVDLYGFFTAIERRQMHEIFATKRTVVRTDILTARNEFMQKLY